MDPRFRGDDEGMVANSLSLEMSMTRVILTPAAVPAMALAELKQWLGITIPDDDAPLARVFAAAQETCESFTGTMPLEQGCEEVLAGRGGWQMLATRPIQSIAAVERISGSGRITLAPDAYEIDLDADGSGRVRLLSSEPGRVAVRFTAGLAPEWSALPESLRHGIVRLAAHQHRERENSGAAPLPPASVAALWRPWRRMRLA
jgi:uncharacterized phiE125 gp8 family phage protein